jgi:hypothetical protein
MNIATNAFIRYGSLGHLNPPGFTPMKPGMPSAAELLASTNERPDRSRQ